MIISRSLSLLKCTAALTKRKVFMKNQQLRKSSHFVNKDGYSWGYRNCLEANKTEVILSELLGGVVWWWIFWHMYHQWGHIVGEFPYPEPEKWTDEELGIPPDDYD